MYLIEHSSQVEDVPRVRVVPSRSRGRATRDSHQHLLWAVVHSVTAFVAVRWNGNDLRRATPTITVSREPGGDFILSFLTVYGGQEYSFHVLFNNMMLDLKSNTIVSSTCTLCGWTEKFYTHARSSFRGPGDEASQRFTSLRTA